MQNKSVNLLLLLSAILFIFSSCTKQSEDTLYNNAKAKLEEAKKLETENKNDEAKKVFSEAVEMYKQFLNEYPSSAKTPEVYNTIAKIYVDNLRDYATAIKYYKELSEKFPNTRDAKYAMFMTAFIYDEMLQDKNSAKEYYKKFLEKYPKDEDPNEKMSESARMMLQMLEENKSIEDIIKQNATSKDTATQKKDIKTDVKKIETKEAPKPGPGPDANNKEAPKPGPGPQNKQEKGDGTPPTKVNQ
jgi:tetratricopeptide (TPR) repeat protein